MRQLLRQSSGLTWIEGDAAHARSFLLHALGHDYPRADAARRPATGLSGHSPHVYVPVEGLFYLRPGMPTGEFQRHVRELWPRLRDTDTALVLLDGVWSRMPELHPEIISLARSRHVVVADEFERPEKIQPARRLQVRGTLDQGLYVKMR